MATTAPDLDQQARILAIARRLMSEVGAQAMSMRQLASACDLNVATLYHYFPSKSALLRAAIEERAYGEQISLVTAPVDRSVPPVERMAALVELLLREGVEEHETWKLLIGETIRNDVAAKESAHQLVEMLDGAVVTWLRDLFPEFTGDADAAARVIRNHVVTCFLEDLMVDGNDRSRRFTERAHDIAALMFG